MPSLNPRIDGILSTKGITAGPRFERIHKPTVGLPVYRKWIEAFTRPRVRLLEPYTVTLPGGHAIELPADMTSDGGSIPMFLIWGLVVVGTTVGGVWHWASLILLLLAILLNPFGLMLIAFLVHDYAVKHAQLIIDGRVTTIQSVWQANNIMRSVNQQVNDMRLLGWVAHVGVTIGAWVAWQKYRRSDKK